MHIWALGDLHLSFSQPSKDMAFFGPTWKDYAQKIEKNWRALIQKEDLVLLPGDLSWASSLEEAKVDLDWIEALPGIKIIIKGNHDYWWASSSKMQASLPPSLHFLHNNAFTHEGISIGGTRLWDTSEYDFTPYILFQENPKAKKEIPVTKEETDAIFQRELERLRRSLSLLDPKANMRIALTHYPPIGADLNPSLASKILEEFHIDLCLFGHLHSVRPHSLPFGTARGVRYLLTSADYVDFTPIKIA